VLHQNCGAVFDLAGSIKELGVVELSQRRIREPLETAELTPDRIEIRFLF
jgi:hypothetical protein